jgi:hypothetical protein
MTRCIRLALASVREIRGDGKQLQCAEQRKKARNTAKMTNDEPPKLAALKEALSS